MHSRGVARSKSILVADVPEAQDTITRCLQGYDVTFVSTLGKARRALSDYYDLIIIGLTFDDSHMFSLVHEVRIRGPHKDTPVIGLRHKPTVLTPATLRGVEDAMRVAGGNTFLDITLEDDGCNALRDEVDRLLKWGKD